MSGAKEGGVIFLSFDLDELDCVRALVSWKATDMLAIN